MNLFQIIKKPLITEKTSLAKDESNMVAFVVDRSATKIEIKQAVEKFFKTEVRNVNTVTVAGKRKRFGKREGKRANWKKAYVTLKEGCSVDFFEV